MKKYTFSLSLLFILLALSFGCAINSLAAPNIRTKIDDTMRHKAEILLRAYPDAGMSLVEEEGGLFVQLGDKKLLFSPWGTCPEALPDDRDDAPLCAMFSQTYPVGPGSREPERGFDPGRVRNETFLKTLYGINAREVEKFVEHVDFFGERLLFSSKHGAAAALKRVTAKLGSIVRETPAVKAYIMPSGGTYAWRTIKSSPRLSAHSFAVCIDLNIQKGVYWLWNPSPVALREARDKYPQAIVDAFESEGFIWGGKWFSFDFMHFEYRPELVPQGKKGAEQGRDEGSPCAGAEQNP